VEKFLYTTYDMEYTGCFQPDSNRTSLGVGRPVDRGSRMNVSTRGSFATTSLVTAPMPYERVVA